MAFLRKEILNKQALVFATLIREEFVLEEKGVVLAVGCYNSILCRDAYGFRWIEPRVNFTYANYERVGCAGKNSLFVLLKKEAMEMEKRYMLLLNNRIVFHSGQKGDFLVVYATGACCVLRIQKRSKIKVIPIYADTKTNEKIEVEYRVY